MDKKRLKLQLEMLVQKASKKAGKVFQEVKEPQAGQQNGTRQKPKKNDTHVKGTER
jgi:hypothetical protein